MSGSARTRGSLHVREHHGARSFWLTWRSGRRRHVVLLGREREGLTGRSARIAADLILGPSTAPAPERRPADG